MFISVNSTLSSELGKYDMAMSNVLCGILPLHTESSIGLRCILHRLCVCYINIHMVDLKILSTNNTEYLNK